MSTLDDWLRPLPIEGEALRFDLSAFRSTVTRQLLQARLRLTARAFGVGDHVVPANVTPDGRALEVDAHILSAANAAAATRLATGPDGAIGYLRSLRASASRLDRAARRPTDVLAYFEASALDQALGSLKFCLPADLRPRLADVLLDTSVVDALLAPDAPSLWSEVRTRELALAAARRTASAERYARRLAHFRRAYGYLGAEDVDFRESESPDAIDARIAAIEDPAAERRSMARSLAAGRAGKARARQAFAGAAAATDPTLVSLVLLARELAAHEDRNRRAKMRLLRDLRDRAERAGLDLATAGLGDFAARPMVRSA